MPSDWTPSSAVNLWHPESAVDLSNDSTSTPEDTSRLGRLKKKAIDIATSAPVRRLLDVNYRSPEELAAYKQAHNGQSPEPIIGQPSDESILPKIKHEPDTYAGGFLNSLYNDYIRPQFSPTGVMANAAPKPVPRIDPAKVEEALNATKAARYQVGLPVKGLSGPLKELPPAPPPQAPGPRFFGGPEGVADTAQEPYKMDIGPIKPLPGQQGIGTVLPRETEGITELPAKDAARLGTTLGKIPEIEPSLEGVDRAITHGGKLPSESPEGYYPKKTNKRFDLPSSRNWKPNPADTVDLGEAASEAGAQGRQVNNETTASKIATGIPKPGEAVAESVQKPTAEIANTKSRDINSFRAQLSVNDTLASRPETAPIVGGLTKANDAKQSWAATTQRRLSDTTKGLSNAEVSTVYDILNGEKIDPKFAYLEPRAQQARAILDEAWNQVPGAIRGEGSSIGYLENYITHIEKDRDMKDALKQIMDWHKNPKGVLEAIKDKFQPLLGDTDKGVGDMFERGLGNPDSPYAKPRTKEGANLEKDLNRIFPMYVESLAKLIFDKPAVTQSKNVLEGLAGENADGTTSKLKNLAQWYIKNYTRYDSAPGLSEAWKSWSQVAQRAVSRSMLGLSPGLQSMHLARVFGNLMPELPLKYMATGAKQLSINPAKVVSEGAKLGLLPNEVRPWAFKRPMEKVDSLIHLFSYVDSIDRLMAYHGSKQMFIDKGLDEASATVKALQFAKKTGLSVDAARPIKAFTPDMHGPWGPFWNAANMFHQVPTKIAEQYVSLAAKIAKSKDPAQAARTIFGVGTAAALTYGFGIKAFHLKPSQFFPDLEGGPIGREINKTMGEVARAGKAAWNKDYNGANNHLLKALKETALIITPGGKSLEGQINKGQPSMFESDNPRIAPLRP